MLDDRTATTPRNVSIKQYRKMKLKMLKEFCIYLPPEEIARMNTLTTEIQIDNFCLGHINKAM
jgi:hypothetical protein